jgi:hypothetical protein
MDAKNIEFKNINKNHFKPTNNDLNQLKRYLNNNYNERNVNDCDKYSRK